ncbi:hypothetical protein KW791_00690 [Candidatus Parcubacteria bacterium]|nr:hypothetical protein [Candidatus Parcubacteria bacterium]
MSSITEEQKDKMVNSVQALVKAMNLQCQIELRHELQEEKAVLTVGIYTPENARFLIGRNGQNLGALEQVLRAMFMKEVQGGYTLVVDVNDYRKSRASHVVDMARQAVMRVRTTQKAEAMQPMSPYERRVVHMELASCPDVATESVGQEGQRRIIIKPYP